MKKQNKRYLNIFEQICSISCPIWIIYFIVLIISIIYFLDNIIYVFLFGIWFLIIFIYWFLKSCYSDYKLTKIINKGGIIEK